MNKLTGFIFALLLLLLNSHSASGQLYDKLVKECNKINSIFSDTGYQSLTIKYYFSTEKNAAYTDSLSASLKIHKGNYYGKFGSTETVQNQQYLVSIYTANNSIVVANPVQRNNLLASTSLDSAFLANDIDSAWITESGIYKSIRFRFTKASGFKNYTITYNKTNYQVQKIAYSLKQQLFNQADTAYLPANPLITIQFSGYTKTAFSDNIFNHATYIGKDSSGGFKGAGNYSSYEVLSTWHAPDTTRSSGFLKPGYLNSQPGPLPVIRRSVLQYDWQQRYHTALVLFAFVQCYYLQRELVCNTCSRKIKSDEVAG